MLGSPILLAPEKANELARDMLARGIEGIDFLVSGEWFALNPLSTLIPDDFDVWAFFT